MITGSACSCVVSSTLEFAQQLTSGGPMRLRTDGVTWREIDGETVILDLASSTYLKTNESGSVLMRMLTDERTETELVDGLVDECLATFRADRATRRNSAIAASLNRSSGR